MNSEALGRTDGSLADLLVLTFAKVCFFLKQKNRTKSFY